MSEWRYSVMLAASAVALTLTMAAWRRRRIAERFAPPKRFAFLNTEPAVKWADHPEIFFKALGMPRHMWDEYHCYNGEFPSSSELRSRYSGLIVTGSHFSVYEPHEWIPRLLQVLRECASLPHLRVIGCCFGCQSVATALGGTVAPNPDGHFVLRNETVKLAPPMRKTLLARASTRWRRESADQTPQLDAVHLLASHGDQVTRLPPGAELLGWSEGSPHELFLCGPHKTMLGCQAHPEFEPSHIVERILPTVLANGRITHAEAEATAASLKQPLHSSLLRDLYRDFLLQTRQVVPSFAFES